MKKNILFTALFLLFFSQVSQAQNTFPDLFVNENLWLTGSNGWIFHTPNDGRTSLYLAPAPGGTADWAAAYFFKNDGSLGLGTQEPLAKLHIRGKDGENIDFLTTGRLKTTSNVGGLWIGDTKYIGASGSGAVILYNGGAPRLSVNEIGDVVIGEGAAANGYKLSVRGKAIAEEVKVEVATNWPDYVFAPSYRLKPLAEVAAYIRTNQHLPGIPSAAEVKANGGVELGAMNAKLLEKVEELTLHAIEQKEQLQQEKADKEALATQLQALQKEVELLKKALGTQLQVLQQEVELLKKR
jgi:hypothetical protein